MANQTFSTMAEAIAAIGPRNDLTVTMDFTADGIVYSISRKPSYEALENEAYQRERAHFPTATNPNNAYDFSSPECAGV